MTPLNYCKSFPLSINSLRITSAIELQILIMAATLPEGIKQSNNQLAKLLHTNRRSIINSITRLKSKRLIENMGTEYHRILFANSETIALFIEMNGENVTPANSEKLSQNGERVSQNSVKTCTHNIKNIRNKRESTLKKNVFVIPTLVEIQNYITEKKLSVNAEMFFEYFTESHWIDSKGNKVRNWKQKLLTWNNHIKPVPAAKQLKPGDSWDSKTEAAYFDNFVKKNAKTPEELDKLLGVTA